MIVFEVILSVLHFFFSLQDGAVCRLVLLVDVAVVVPSGLAAMFTPVAQAEPTVIVIAVSTSHVHTTFILFCRGVTLWALLRVCKQPGVCLAFAALLFLCPLVDFKASCGSMVLVVTLDAEGVTTLAGDTEPSNIVSNCNDILTPLFGTPFDILIILGVGFSLPVLVL